MATAGWGKVSNWAAEVEEEEAQNGGTLPVEDFPSLQAAATQAPKPKKKATKMGLGDFLGAQSSGFRGASDKEVIASLPTSSRGKTGEVPSGGLGGGFRDYGGRGDRGYGDEERERRPRQEDMGPSRADESEAWGKDRKFVPNSGGGSSFGSGYEARGGGVFGGFDRSNRDRGEPRDDGPSRADESEAWGRDKRYTPASGGGGFGDKDRGFGGRDRGFGDRDRGFGGDRGREVKDRPEVDSDWGRAKPAGDGYGFDSSSRERGYSFANGSRVDGADRWTKSRDDSAHGGGPEDRPSERPRLNLKPRTVPASDSPSVEAAGDSAPVAVSRKSNPFGNARPREEVLKEKGVDYKKQELKLEHDSTLRADTEEEEKLKSDIEMLKTKLEALSANDSTDPEELEDLKSEIELKETNLLKLAAELDDQVKYAKDSKMREGGSERGRETRSTPGRDGERRVFGSRSRDRFEESRPAYGW